MAELPADLVALIAAGQVKRLRVEIDLEPPQPTPERVPVVTLTVGAPRSKE